MDGTRSSLARPRLHAPPGARDTHIHIYGPRDRYPLAPSCARIPPDGPVPAYRAVMDRLGLVRVVIVQPIAYGTDNRATLDAMAAPYETSKDGPPSYGDVGVLARALIEAAPERMLWAGNWPHPGTGDDPPDDAVLLEPLIDWADGAATRRKILVDNPARLYGFDKG